MIEFERLHIGQKIYILEIEPVLILELTIIELGYNADYQKRIKVANKDISFEVDFDDIVDKTFTDKDVAHSVAIKYIFVATNKYIRDITDGYFSDYFELDKALEKYKITHPEVFI